MRLLILVGLLIPACGGNVDNPGTLTGNGGNSGGVNSSTGGFTGAGGECICDFKPDTGGTTSEGGHQATGCTGSFELIQSTTGLCVAKMATMSAPSGYSDYQIDVTEVTRGQYDAWLATNPALPVSTDVNCGYAASYAEQGTGYVSKDADHHPVVYVDWCDAYEYCLGVGKRLCGAIGGGPLTNSWGFDDAIQSQWYRACSSGGTNMYPYGNIYQASYCDGIDDWIYNNSTLQTVVAGSLTNCVASIAGFAGVYDLSGNVWEWEDSCNATGQSTSCLIRGGCFGGGDSVLTCSYNFGGFLRDGVDQSIGFRCCSI